jgi:diguanylate cyclase (GGDEF)-like protein/PAS domain S-box-containing protein
MTSGGRALARSTLVVLAFSLLSSAHADDSIDLQLRWHHQFQFAGYYAAVEKGFYKQEGLDVRLHAGDPQHQPVPEVLSGRAQYAEGNSEILFQRLQGAPLVALAAIFQHSPSILLVRRDSGIASVHDLIGKRVMLMNLTQDADFLTMFLNEGVSLAQVHLIPSSYNIDDLITGKVDAFNSYSTNEPYYLKQRGIPYTIIDPINYRIDFYSDVLFTTETELRNHPKRVEAMRRATLKGWHYAMDHQEEIIDLLINKYHVEKTRDHLEFEATEMRKLILPDLVEIGHMNPGRWQHMANTFVHAGLAKPDYSLDGFIYDPNPKRIPEWVVPVLIAALIVLAIITFVTYHLYRLNRRLSNTQGHLEESEERLQLALAAANQGWFDLDIRTGETTISRECARILGLDPGARHNTLQTWENSIHPDDREATLAGFQRCLSSGGPVAMEYRRQTPDRGWAWMRSVGQITEWGPAHQPLRMIGIHTDISEQKLVELELERQARTDHLTGVNNRGYFMELAEHELRRSVRYGTPLTVFMLDIDFFKQINDRYGHKVGDTVLKRLTEVCLEALREVDILGRMGGEEFAIILPETSQLKGTEVAERLRKTIAETAIPMDAGLPLHCTVSIGVTAMASTDDNIDVLLNLADKALYEAKNSGRNSVCVSNR